MVARIWFWTVAVVVICIPLFASSAMAATLNVGSGWNLLSARASIDANAVFGNNSNLISIWKWEGGKWAVYLPASADKGAEYAASKGFTLLAQVSPGEGFWINAKTAQTLNWTGTEVEDTTISLNAGWNLKGLRSSTPVNVKDLFYDPQKYASVWKWVSGSWAVYLPQSDGGAAYAKAKGFSELKTINPGEGFWVNASQAGDVVATPPVVAGTVTYPTSETGLQKIGLFLKGLLSEIPEVEMPPVPGATVKVYATTDTNYYTPLAQTTTDQKGQYSFSAKDFDNPATQEVEPPPQVPLMVKAEFKSPIDPTKKVSVKAIVDPTEDPSKKNNVEVNPLTTAIAQKVKDFVENTFQVQLTKEIMDAAKPFINLIAQEVQKKGLTFFKEEDLVIGEYKDANSTEEKPDFQPPPNQNIADKVIDKGTAGLFVNMETLLMEKANAGQFTQTVVNISQEKKMEHYIKYLSSLGIKIQAGKTGEDSQKIIAFIAAPPHIPEDQIPGTMLFKDRAFRKIKPDVDLTPQKINAIKDEGFKFYLKGALEGPVISYEAVEAFMNKAEEGLTTNLTKLASVVKDKFIWQTETVQMVGGIPVFGNDVTPTTGADVSASELISQLTGKLGGTPEEIAKEIAISPHYLVKFMEPLFNQKMQEIKADKSIENKQEAMNQFLKSLKDIETIRDQISKTEFFKRAVEEISHAIFAGFEPDLYGKVLTGSTELKVKSAFVLLKQMLDRPYLIDVTKGWFIKNQEGEKIWLSPNYSNFKFLEPKNDMDPDFVNSIFSAILGTQIQANSDFDSLFTSYWSAVDSLPEPDIFKFSDTAMQEVLGVSKANSVTVKGVLLDTEETPLANKALQLRKFDQGGLKVEQTVNTDNQGKFVFTNVQTGFPYEVYNQEKGVFLPFFADGFQDPLDLGDWVMPPTFPIGGQEGGPVVVPGISLFVDDVYFNPINPKDPQNGKAVGVKFSNFASGQPFIVADADIYWTKDGLKAAFGAGIAELPQEIKGVLGLAQIKPAFTIEELEGKVPIQIKNLSITLQWVELIPQPKENNAVYAIKDKDGKYFLVEIRSWDKDAQGKPSGLIDMGFLIISNTGQVQVPFENFTIGPTQGGGGGQSQFYPYMLGPGEYFDLDTKSQSAPASEPMGSDPKVIEVADLRWTGSFYDTYWEGKSWPERIAALPNSDKALAAINGATMKLLDLSGVVPKLTSVTEIKPAVPGQLLLVETKEGKAFVVAILKVTNPEIVITVASKEEILDQAMKFIGTDMDMDGIPGILDPNDFDPNIPMKGEMQPQPGPGPGPGPGPNPGPNPSGPFADSDGDGIPDVLDTSPNDPNQPFQNGSQDQDQDGLKAGFEGLIQTSDNDPNSPGFMGPSLPQSGGLKMAVCSGNPGNNFTGSPICQDLGPEAGILMIKAEQDGTKKANLFLLNKNYLLQNMASWNPTQQEFSIVLLDTAYQGNKVVGYLMGYRITKGPMPGPWKLEKQVWLNNNPIWQDVVQDFILYEVFDGYYQQGG